ncbi:hypothetical protein ACOSQ2_012994 [Xanthoceras sorbifolium]
MNKNRKKSYRFGSTGADSRRRHACKGPWRCERLVWTKGAGGATGLWLRYRSWRRDWRCSATLKSCDWSALKRCNCSALKSQPPPRRRSVAGATRFYPSRLSLDVLLLGCVDRPTKLKESCLF